MKIFAFLMAITVLALSVVPCADDADAMDNSKAKTELTKSTHQTDSPQSAQKASQLKPSSGAVACCIGSAKLLVIFMCSSRLSEPTVPGHRAVRRGCAV